MANILAMKNELEQKLDKLKALSTEEVALGAQLSKKSEELDKEIAAKEAQNQEIKDLLASLDSGVAYNSISTNTDKYRQQLEALLKRSNIEVKEELNDLDIVSLFKATVELIKRKFSWREARDYKREFPNRSSLTEVKELLTKIDNELKDLAQVDQEPSLEGRQLLMVLSPLKKKK